MFVSHPDLDWTDRDLALQRPLTFPPPLPPQPKSDRLHRPRPLAGRNLDDFDSQFSPSPDRSFASAHSRPPLSVDSDRPNLAPSIRTESPRPGVFFSLAPATSVRTSRVASGRAHQPFRYRGFLEKAHATSPVPPTRAFLIKLYRHVRAIGAEVSVSARGCHITPTTPSTCLPNPEPREFRSDPRRRRKTSLLNAFHRNSG